jgi:hypothetical protein
MSYKLFGIRMWRDEDRYIGVRHSADYRDFVRIIYSRRDGISYIRVEWCDKQGQVGEAVCVHGATRERVEAAMRRRLADVGHRIFGLEPAIHEMQSIQATLSGL